MIRPLPSYTFADLSDWSHISAWLSLEPPQATPPIAIHRYHPLLRRIQNDRHAYQPLCPKLSSIITSHIFTPQMEKHSASARECLAIQKDHVQILA